MRIAPRKLQPLALLLCQLCVRSSHYLLRQQRSLKHVRTGCDVIKTCWMELSPPSSMILQYMFIITPQGIYSEHSRVPHPPVYSMSSSLPVHLIYVHINTKRYKHVTAHLRLHPHKLISNHLPRHSTNVEVQAQSLQPTHAVLQPQASYTQGPQLCSEDSSLPLNHATLILRTCRLAAFHFMQLRLKALLISSKLKSPMGKHSGPPAWWSSYVAQSHMVIIVL